MNFFVGVYIIYLCIFPSNCSSAVTYLNLSDIESFIEEEIKKIKQSGLFWTAVEQWSCHFDCMISVVHADEQDLCIEWKVLTMKSRNETCPNVIPMAWIQNRTVSVLQSKYYDDSPEMYEELMKIGIFDGKSNGIWDKLLLRITLFEGNENLMFMIILLSSLVVTLLFTACLKKIFFRFNNNRSPYFLTESEILHNKNTSALPIFKRELQPSYTI